MTRPRSSTTSASRPHAATRRASGAVRGEVRLAGLWRVSHGLGRPATDGDAFTELLLDLDAWLLVLPDGAVFTHLTAALLRGWQLPKLPDRVPVFAAVRGTERRPRRPGLLVSRLVGTTCGEQRHGLPVDSAEEILLRAARELGVLDLVIMIDSALRVGDLEPARMETLLDSRRPGVSRLRKAWLLSDAASESAGESVLRAFHRAIGVPVEPQVEVYDDAGSFLGRVDLLVVGTREVHEYDGAEHRRGDQHRTDLRRERALGASYRRRGFTLDDLLNHPATVMHEIDRVLDRGHQAARLRRWRTLVASSMFSDACRQRLLNRWQRDTGAVDWGPAA